MKQVKTLAEKALLNRKKNFLDKVQKLYEEQKAMKEKLLEETKKTSQN